MREMAAAERIHEYASSKETEGEWRKEGIPPNWVKTGEIMIKNISARYAEGKPLVLDNVSFDIKGGEKVGLIGRTGSGKSTLFLILTRILEAEGINSGSSITIDGQDIYGMGLHDLRSNIVTIS